MNIYFQFFFFNAFIQFKYADKPICSEQKCYDQKQINTDCKKKEADRLPVVAQWLVKRHKNKGDQLRKRIIDLYYQVNAEDF